MNLGENIECDETGTVSGYDTGRVIAKFSHVAEGEAFVKLNNYIQNPTHSIFLNSHKMNLGENISCDGTGSVYGEDTGRIIAKFSHFAEGLAFTKLYNTEQNTQCWCESCDLASNDFRTHMAICPNCGDKRCKKALNHENECSENKNSTSSNIDRIIELERLNKELSSALNLYMPRTRDGYSEVFKEDGRWFYVRHEEAGKVEIECTREHGKALDALAENDTYNATNNQPEELCPVCGKGHIVNELKDDTFDYSNIQLHCEKIETFCDSCGSILATPETIKSNLQLIEEAKTSYDLALQNSYIVGAKGVPHSDYEHSLFIYFLKGHCWENGDWDAEKQEYRDMWTRVLYSVWRARSFVK